MNKLLNNLFLFFILILLVIMIIVVIYNIIKYKQGYKKRGYYIFLPELFDYDSEQKAKQKEEDIKEFKRLVNERTKEDEEFFKKVDVDITNEYMKIISNETQTQSQTDLLLMIHNLSLYIFIISNKLYYNRKRPYQLGIVDKNKILKSKTSNNPSYPSGHAIQSYVLSELLSKKYPNKKQELYDLAEKISLSRVKGGVHFPSDIKFGKKLALQYVNSQYKM